MDARDYLLDSHILIWSLYQQDKLLPKHCAVLESDCGTWISIATIWQIEIKKHAGKLPLPDAIWDQASAVGHRFLNINSSHALLAARLPLHHGDPFDRMLIAQAMIENLLVLTVDRNFGLYDIDMV